MADITRIMPQTKKVEKICKKILEIKKNLVYLH